jgi:hypothetical protein
VLGSQHGWLPIGGRRKPSNDEEEPDARHDEHRQTAHGVTSGGEY